MRETHACGMRAVIYDRFGDVPQVREVPDPVPPPGGVVVAVKATGLCRSDWHGWRGHDPGIRLPHVPGHEFAGVVAAVGAGVEGWAAGDRVTAPFVCACGTCAACLAGDQQVCERQEQPGFTHWGSFADRVVVHHAEVNLVRLPDAVGFATAAALGCRFATAFRAVVQPDARAMARRCGAATVLDAAAGETVRELTAGGAHLSIDALGSEETLTASIEGLRRRGRHVQVGLLPSRPAVPMELVVARELEILGSHGMAAHVYARMMPLVEAGVLRPADLVTGELALDAAPAALAGMDGPTG
jgi:D-arabinose 1-dehydrogenase-like Zn-dependent alcohol dehydrogenase